MDTLILPLDDSQATLEIVGGKGASLTKLTNAGLPVPDGFYITTTAYQQFVEENDLQTQIMAVLESADISKPQSLEVASQKIHSLFMEAVIPQKVVIAITGAYGALPGPMPVVAVRSSATAEDLPDLSFAGQQDTFLNIKGLPDVLPAVQKCWASLWTARAIGYRIRNNINQQIVKLSVVVQLMVPADAAGILFTANPVNNKRDEMMITASWGLGEAVVGGAVTPDTITVNKSSGDTISYDIADKEVMTVRVNGGTENQPVPAELRRTRVLDNGAINRLWQLGRSVEELYEEPMDIEWAMVDNKIALVQARPITSLGKELPPAPTEWIMPDPKGHYMRASIIDLMPDPLTPVFETLGIATLNNQIQQLVGWMTNTNYVMSSYSVTTINGYAYMNGALNGRDWLFLIFRLIPAIFPILRKGKEHWRDVACVRYAEITQIWEVKNHSKLPAQELLRGVREVSDAAMEHLTAVMIFLGQCAGSEGLVTNIYNKMVMQEGDPLANTLVMGYDSAPVRGEKGLYDLAQWCQMHNDLSAYLLNTKSESISVSMESKTIPDGVNEVTWSEWESRFTNYLKEFGFSIYDLDFGEPLPAENPTPFLENLKLFISGKGQNPHERQKVAAERREALVEESFSRLKGLKARIFRLALNWAQPLAPLREDGIAYMGYGYPVIRHMLMEIGRRMVNNNALHNRQDIFWLVEDELEYIVKALDSSMPLDNYMDQIEERKALWQARKSVTPPPQIPVKEKYMGFSMDTVLAHGSQEGDIIKGIGASSGQVTATARILHGPEDFDKLQPGDVLVAPITTPAWTPLFVMASGVVTDIGGPLSHGSIVAREYGIPAVLGTSVASRVITDGQVVTVNGTTGEVMLNYESLDAV
jgi:pyruvate,water dikinase